MLTDERIKEIQKLQKYTDVAYPYVDELIEEIKRLRAELADVRRTLTLHANERLRAEVAELRSELARYQTPNVDNVEVLNERP